MTGFGAEIRAGTPEYEWIAQVIRAVEQRTGRAARWNGRLYEEKDPVLLGTAHDDGSMTLSRTKVFDAIRTAYAAGEALTAEQLDGARHAMVIAVHEARHLCNQLGEQDNSIGAVRLYDPDEIALEEGLVDTWAHREVDGVIQQLDMDRAVPGVIGAHAVVSYSAYGEATDALVHGLADVTGVRAGEVRRLLQETDRTQRWSAVADLVIDQRLDGVVPPDHRDQIRGKLQSSLRMEFAKLPAVQLSGMLDQSGQESYGRGVGRDAIGSLNRTLGEIESHYFGWRDQQGPGAQYEAAPRMTMSMQDILRERRRAASPVDPEVAGLRKFLGDHQPVAHAPAATSAAETAPSTVRQLRVKQDHGHAKE